MKELYHPNVITLKHAFYTQGDKPDEIYLNVVMDYVPETVFRILKHYNKMKQQVPMILVKLYAYQAFRALAYIHALGICHRDIKPQNLLVYPDKHILKVCDFGSAKRLKQGEVNVSYICSRYYRAPELIFGSTEYGQSIDVWSVGCVIAELLLGQPLFPGDSGVDQLVEIIKVLGTPSRDQIKSMNPNYSEFKFPVIKANDLKKIFSCRKTGKDVAVDLVTKILKYNPQQRPKPLKALQHQFFDELRADNVKLPNNQPLPDLFDFSEEEKGSTTAEVIKSLIPGWYMEKKAAEAQLAKQ